MMEISYINTGAVQPLTAVGKAVEVFKVQRSEEAVKAAHGGLYRMNTSHRSRRSPLAATGQGGMKTANSLFASMIRSRHRASLKGWKCAWRREAGKGGALRRRD